MTQRITFITTPLQTGVKTLCIVVLLAITVHCTAQPLSWGIRMAQSVMKANPDSLVVKKYVTHDDGKKDEVLRPAVWDYEQGVLLEGFVQLWNQTHDERYFQYLKKITDHFIQQDGTIRTYDLTEYNIDDIAPGRMVLALYKATKEEKYKKAANALREQLAWQPRTKEGGFWHKHRYPYQMWLDGLYMAEPFYTEFAAVFHEPADYDDIALQLVAMEKHVRDSKTGLLYHAWDESRKQRWANAVTGQSPEFWSRGMGWYAMALVDVLEIFPNDHPKQKAIVAILQRLAAAIKTYQDDASGVWYQVTNRGDKAGNYLEASASCMFTYSLAKGVRLGYLDKTYGNTARKAFEGILKTFMETDADGTLHLIKACSGAGLGGTPYRDGSYEYYIKESTRKDDLKGIGPFISASIEIELLKP